LYLLELLLYISYKSNIDCNFFVKSHEFMAPQ